MIDKFMFDIIIIIIIIIIKGGGLQIQSFLCCYL